jgi:hypothetical protein
MKKKLLLMLTLSLVFQVAISQTRKKVDSSTVIIFNEGGTQTSKKKRSSESNIIKIAPLGFLSGTFPLLYERRFTDFFSIQVAGGLTARNYVRNAILKETAIEYKYPWNDSYTDQAAPAYDMEHHKAKMGFMASVQPRIYFASEGLDGSFLGLSFDYYRYNFEIPRLTGSGGSYTHNGSPQSEYENIKDFMVHFGYQTLYDNISLEYTTAIGLRSTTGSKYAAGYNGSQLIEGFATYKQSALNFNIGIKVGYHF